MMTIKVTKTQEILSLGDLKGLFTAQELPGDFSAFVDAFIDLPQVGSFFFKAPYVNGAKSKEPPRVLVKILAQVTRIAENESPFYRPIDHGPSIMLKMEFHFLVGESVLVDVSTVAAASPYHVSRCLASIFNGFWAEYNQLPNEELWKLS